MSLTPQYGWDLPDVGADENTWGGLIRTLWTDLDTLLGGVNATEFAILDGATVSTAELNILDGVTATFTEINLLAGLATTSAELGYVSGVTSAIQTQIDTKSPIASPTFTGTPAAPTAAADTNTTQIATTAFVQGELSASGVGTMFTSSEQTYTNGGIVTVAHGLGAKPSLVSAVAICKTAQTPYAVGDELVVGTGHEAHSGVGNFGSSIHSDTTNVNLQIGANGMYGQGSSGGALILNTSDWKIIIRAWV